MSEADQTTRAPEPPVIPHFICSLCGALCDARQKRCWMCQTVAQPLAPGDSSNPYQALPANPELITASVRPPLSSRYDSAFSVLLIGCFVLAVLVGVGMATETPGALVVYLILVGPAFAITGVRALWQMGATGRTQPARLLIGLAISFAITIAAISLLALAGIVLLFALCFWELSNL